MGLETGTLKRVEDTPDKTVFDAHLTGTRTRGLFSILFGVCVLAASAYFIDHPQVWVFAALLLIPALLFVREGFKALREKRKIEIDRAVDRVLISMGDSQRALKISRIAAIEVMRPAKDQARLPSFSPCSLVSLLLKNRTGLAIEAAPDPKVATELAAMLRHAINSRLEIINREWDVEIARSRQPAMSVPPAWVGFVAIHSVTLICAYWLFDSGMKGELLMARNMGVVMRWVCFASAIALPMLGEALRRMMRRAGALQSKEQAEFWENANKG